MARQPNFFCILADQLRYQSCGFAGDSAARTPNIDLLASEGAVFTNAVSNTPVCAAFRASLLTGKYTTSTGMVINELRLNPDHHPHALAKCLRTAGYRPLHIGKWHLYANELGNHYDTKNSFVPPGKHRLGFDDLFAHYGFHHEYFGQNAYYHLDTDKKIHFPAGVYEPDGQTDLAIGAIRRSVEEGVPFALFLALGTPHDPWEEWNVPVEFLDLFRDTHFPAPPNYEEGHDPYGDAWARSPHSPEAVERRKRIYYAMVSNLDTNVGRILGALKETGIDDETVVMFASDHGEMFGAHGRMAKNIFYEEAARIPLIFRYPAVGLRGAKSDACISTVDIMPTLLGFAGIEIPRDVEGMDLHHHVTGDDGPEPEFAFLQNTGACAAWEDGHEWRALRDKRFTYATYRVDGKEMLFDNINDPYQISDLSGNPEYRATRRELAAKLDSKMTQIDDTNEPSSYYRDHWISRDRIIEKTAHST